ncbi:MAG: DUF1588 domain-containing protein, partial [Myxococcota bacterium]
EVERMMADPKFARSRDLFWMDYSLLTIAPFSSVEPEVADELRESLLITLNHLSGVESQAVPLAELLRTQELWMTPAVAGMAGARTIKDGMAAYSADELPHRLGVTTHPGFLAAMGTTSFVGRGIFMSQRLLCTTIISPPSDENATERIQETVADTEELTPREASEFRFNLEPACQGCHQVFEPIAYAYERFDIDGRYVETDADGRALFTEGVLPQGDGRTEIAFGNAEELVDALATMDGVERCLVDNMLEYASGYSLRASKRTIDAAFEGFRAEGRTFEALARVIALSPQLRWQKVATP